MPTSTARYRFEFRLLDWAETFGRGLCGARCSFFIGLREDGTVRRVYLAPPGDRLDGSKKAALAETYRAWFLYSPFEAPGTGYVEWLSLPRELAERWLQRPLEASDFLDVRSTPATAAEREAWPDSWRVIVG